MTTANPWVGHTVSGRTAQIQENLRAGRAWDFEELTVRDIMVRFLMQEEDWTAADIEEMTFLDIEAEYFNAGGKEFR